MKKIIILFIALFILGCAKEIEEPIEIPKEVDSMKLTSVFENNQDIPSEYTCDGDNVNPELNIEDIPENTKRLALIMDDPDAPAGTWVHWIVWNIPPETKTIPKAAVVTFPQGTNDFKKLVYGGPCPPSGTHRYFFKLYALDTELDLEPGSSKADLEAAMQGSIIEKTELIGKYSR